MAALTAAQRAQQVAKFHQFLSSNGITVGTGCDKAAVALLLGAADDWRAANEAAYNTAIPAAIRGSFTAKQKALALMFVIELYYEVTP